MDRVEDRSDLLFFPDRDVPPPGVDNAVTADHLAAEEAMVGRLLEEATFDQQAKGRIRETGRALVEHVRAEQRRQSPLDGLLHEYDLSSEEGVILMCLAEALLRVPDAATADRLIHDKLAHTHWDQHLGQGRSLLVNASTWGLMLTGRMVQLEPGPEETAGSLLRQLVARTGEPVIRAALRQAMHVMAHQFVMGRDMGEALRRGSGGRAGEYRYSFDMLGEAALTAEDAQAYFDAYRRAIETLAAHGGVPGDHGISVKLSALHPRFEYAQRERLHRELVPRLGTLALGAREAGVPLAVDAEEARRLEVTLEMFAAVLADRRLDGWDGFGLAVQAYQKRAPAVIGWLAELAGRLGRRTPLRLVKGAYWDHEIKAAQQAGLAEYPVYTRKANTDMAYLACARRILARRDVFFPQFATHNAHTVAALLELAGGSGDFEFQRLHGMGQALYQRVTEQWGHPCRVYAPVGGHEALLPYLVRRLLENGANTSFVNRIVDADTPVEVLLADPADAVRGRDSVRHPGIPLPVDLYGPERPNPLGPAMDAIGGLRPLAAEMDAALRREHTAVPLFGGDRVEGGFRTVLSPTDGRPVGRVAEATPEAASRAMDTAAAAAERWRRTPVEERVAILLRAADLLERHRAELMALVVAEGGRTVGDALAEVREAVDFCRYYAEEARRGFVPRPLPGPTGERNTLRLEGRGPFVCISPWNFPVAIFTGQVVAALAAGNPVVAKPAHQTALTGMRVIELLREAGVPADVLHYLPGPSSVTSSILLNHPNLAGVAFTGSTETARRIHRMLAAREGPIVPLIAETGGQNAMLVDSSALPEQVVTDVLQSAFGSAGQRCSALRVLFVQEEASDRLLRMLRGAMAELRVGDPRRLATDVGPVIDADARDGLERHIEAISRIGKIIHRCAIADETAHGTYVAPTAVEIDGIQRLEREVFGPVLHVIRYRSDRLDDVIDAVNGTGYGLTLGIHSRIDETADHIARRMRVGNVYINRNMIGAVVGVQPFGGQGLSGTGPKAGGPHYLPRFANEKTVTINTAAVGGNAALLAGED